MNKAELQKIFDDLTLKEKIINCNNKLNYSVFMT